MPLRVAIQMDPIEHVDIAGDSSFALLLEAQARGHEIFYYTPGNLAQTGTKVVARGFGLQVADREGAHFSLGPERTEDLSDWDVVLLRQDPPFDMGYLTTTYILERLYPKTLVVNNPYEVRNAPEKLFVFDFAKYMPATLITRNPDDVKAFRVEYNDIILKPLYGNGGAAIFRVSPDDGNLAALVELFLTSFREPFIVQEYRPEIIDGDKRIILVDGEVAGAINRVPAKGETRSNMHVGGTPMPTVLTDREQEICAALGPELKRRGLLFTGIDVIGGYLTEINVTSPTGIRQVKNFGGNDIAAMIWDAIEGKIKQG